MNHRSAVGVLSAPAFEGHRGRSGQLVETLLPPGLNFKDPLFDLDLHLLLQGIHIGLQFEDVLFYSVVPRDILVLSSPPVSLRLEDGHDPVLDLLDSPHHFLLSGIVSVDA